MEEYRLPEFGPISLSMVNVEIGRPAEQEISLSEQDVKKLAGWAGGGLSFSRFLNKQWNPDNRWYKYKWQQMVAGMTEPFRVALNYINFVEFYDFEGNIPNELKCPLLEWPNAPTYPQDPELEAEYLPQGPFAIRWNGSMGSYQSYYYYTIVWSSSRIQIKQIFRRSSTQYETIEQYVFPGGEQGISIVDDWQMVEDWFGISDRFYSTASTDIRYHIYDIAEINPDYKCKIDFIEQKLAPPKLQEELDVYRQEIPME